jgi:hypothetical protein
VVKKDKEEVGYTPVAKMKSERCELCKHFRALYNRCELVKGQILPRAWCKLFAKR